VALKNLAVIREAAAQVAAAAVHVVDSYATARIEQEPEFTGRMLGAIEERLRDFTTKGVRWRAKTLTDHGTGAQEKQYGADFAGVLEIDLPTYKLSKGFLAQAKRVEPGMTFRADEFHRLRDQCRLMLDLSPASYVFLYSRRDIVVVPATAVVAVTHVVNPHAFYSRGVARFYEEHFESFIGDPRINAPHIDALAGLREQYNARSALRIEATQ